MTNIATEIEKLYDDAYKQGFGHALQLVQIMQDRKSVSQIIDDLEAYIKEKYPDPAPLAAAPEVLDLILDPDYVKTKPI